MEEEKATVIIKFRNGIVQANIDSIMALEANIKRVIPSINAISAVVPKKRLGNVQSEPSVEYIELDQEAHILGRVSPDFGFVGETLPFTQSIPWGISKIRADQVWLSGNKGTGIKVCIIDTGIDYNHEDIKDNYKGGYNFLNNTNNPLDDHGHGTHVSGTIAALDNDIGVIGVAPEAYIYSVKVLDANGSGSYSNIIAGIDWAINNQMQIISMSLGGSGFSQALKDACDAAYNAGIVIIAAAGNSGSDTDTIGYPAKYDSVIAVGATDQNEARAPFSSVGPTLEVCGPGVNVLSTVPKGTCKMCDPSGYRQANGTSMSTPHVSGTAALILKAHPTMTNVEVRHALDNTAVHLGTPGRNIQYGYGRIDAKAAVDLTPPPAKKYACSGAPDFQCVEDPNGQYASLAECQAACTAPSKRYRCTGAPDFQCVEDPNGQYASLAECQVVCKAPQIRKFNAHLIGNPNNPNGVIVIKSSRGNYTADEACKFVCDTLKTMDP